MALQPHWFSNLLGGFYFMGSFLGAHMLLALMSIYGAAHLGISDLVSPKQRHDLGKLCFGFTVFWTYLMWAQFLVIWYGNLPEETGFVFARLWGDWLPVGVAVGWGCSSSRSSACSAWRRRRSALTIGVLRHGEPAGALAGALPAGDAVGHRRSRAPSSDCPRPARRCSSWACYLLVLRAVRPDLPHGLAAAGRDHPRPGARARRDAAEFEHEEGRRTMCRRS